MPGHLKIFELMNALDKLKHLKRTGWVHNNIPEPETVASHMYRMAVLAMSLSGTVDVDINKCVRMALVHDIAESIVGDITPHCGVTAAEKFKLESDAMSTITSWLPSEVGDEWKELWLEYEEHKSPEGNVVMQLDKLDMLGQALAYEEKFQVDLSQFFKSTMDVFNSEPFITWAHDINERHNNRHK